MSGKSDVTSKAMTDASSIVLADDAEANCPIAPSELAHLRPRRLVQRMGWLDLDLSKDDAIPSLGPFLSVETSKPLNAQAAKRPVDSRGGLHGLRFRGVLSLGSLAAGTCSTVSSECCLRV